MIKWLFFIFVIHYNTTLRAQDSIYTEVDIAPLFMGCADPLTSKEQQENCSATKILEFVHKQLVYPDSAKAKKIEGVVVVRFVVDSMGRITQAELRRDLGEGCGAEALRVVGMLPLFTPAQKDGQAVAAQMTLPIRFRSVDIASSKTEDFYQLHWGTAYSNALTKSELTELMILPLVIRDNNGDTYAAEEVEMNFIYKNKVLTEKGRSNALTPAMFKLLQKAKPGSVITFSVHFTEKMQRIEVFREFELK